MTILRRVLHLAALALLVLAAPSARAAGPWPGQTEADWVVRDYGFASGEMKRVSQDGQCRLPRATAALREA